jgi:dolichol-phosphate mannosyltransferase
MGDDTFLAKEEQNLINNTRSESDVEINITPVLPVFIRRKLTYRYDNLTVIIPTLNEEKNIYELMYYIDKQYPGIHIIVADDGSQDRTQLMVNQYNYKNKNVTLLNRSNHTIHGLTASVIDAIKITKTRYFVVIDGDFQHPPEKIKEIHSKLYFWQDNDIVVGTRNKIVKEWAIFRRFASKTAIYLGQIRLLLRGIYCKDVVSGFFGGKTILFKKVIDRYEDKFEKEGYKVLFELLKYVDTKVRISNVYYDFGMRKRGKSKMNGLHVFAYLKSVIK